MFEAEKFLQATLNEFSCNTGTLHRAKGEVLELVASIGVPEMILEKVTIIPFGKGIAGVAAATKQPVELCNLQQDLGGVAKEDARKTGVSGSLAVPILDENQVVLGSLGIGKFVPYEFSDEEKQRLIDIGQSLVKLL